MQSPLHCLRHQRVLGVQLRRNGGLGQAFRSLSTDVPKPTLDPASYLTPEALKQFNELLASGQKDMPPPMIGVSTPARARVVRHSGLTEDEVGELAKLSRTQGKRVCDIPEQLVERLKEVLKGRHAHQLGAYHDRLKEKQFERYSLIAQGNDASPIRYSWKEALGYAGVELLPNYGVARRVLSDTLARVPEEDRKEYKTMLDFGGGPGTSILAARDEPMLSSFKEATIVDPSRSMWEVAVKLILGQVDYYNEAVDDILARFAEERETQLGLLWCPSLPKLIQGLDPDDLPQYDVVNCSYALSELPSDQARAVTLGLLWCLVKPGGILILTEGGDPVGQRVIQDARALFHEDRGRLWRSMHRLLKVDMFKHDGRIVAPCTSQKPCPLYAASGPNDRFPSGCYFLQEVPRMLTQRTLKGQGLGKRSSKVKYSYLAMRKDHELKAEKDARFSEMDPEKAKEEYYSTEDDFRISTSRLLRPSLIREKHVTLDMCTSEGTLDRLVLPKVKDGPSGTLYYRTARKSHWGGIWKAPKPSNRDEFMDDDEEKGELKQQEGEKEEEQKNIEEV